MPWGHAAEALVQAGARESGRLLAPENTLDIGSRHPFWLPGGAPAAPSPPPAGRLPGPAARHAAGLRPRRPRPRRRGAAARRRRPAPPRRPTPGDAGQAGPAQLAAAHPHRAALEDAAPAVELPGRVVADPSAGGRVQAPFAGIVEPGPRACRCWNKAVRPARCWPGCAPAWRQWSARRASPSRPTWPLPPRGGRVARHPPGPAGGRRGAEDIDTAAPRPSSLARQHAALGTALGGREALRPLAGVVAAGLVLAGQRVEAGAELFELIRPDRLMVEALAYDAGHRCCHGRGQRRGRPANQLRAALCRRRAQPAGGARCRCCSVEACRCWRWASR